MIVRGLKAVGDMMIAREMLSLIVEKLKSRERSEEEDESIESRGMQVPNEEDAQLSPAKSIKEMQ